jgi:hypothetical protein
MGQATFGLDHREDAKNWPLLQCGQRAYSMVKTRCRNAATDSISAGCGDGAPSGGYDIGFGRASRLTCFAG